MSEFQEKHAVARLIGAPPGYVGFGDGKTGEGQLVNDLLKHPNSVILFDEVEKAHPDTFNVFLSLLDDGEITGTTGKVASAKNCIIIMTSNLGTREGAKAQLGFDTNKTGKSASAKAVNDFFLTEMRGRMTSIVEFVDLDELSYRRIVAERITEIGKMLTSRNLRIVASEALITHILKLNKNSEYGARKIAGTVDDIINYPLSIQLLKGKIKNNSTIHLDWVTDVLVIEAKKIKVAVKESIKIKKEI
jgi:ATP-dependent Clp protease ATP-binding subunit ClpA